MREGRVDDWFAEQEIIGCMRLLNAAERRACSVRTSISTCLVVAKNVYGIVRKEWIGVVLTSIAPRP